MTARVRPLVLFVLVLFAIVFSPHEARAQGNEHPNPDSTNEDLSKIKSVPFSRPLFPLATIQIEWPSSEATAGR
jgi:hypothetical protein